jgi:hypothetical protein
MTIIFSKRLMLLMLTPLSTTMHVFRGDLLRKMEVGGDRESIVIGYTSTYIISAFHN